MIASLPNNVAATLLYDWPFWARPEQLAPDGDWLIWLILAGRGWGKTRTGAEWIQGEVAAGRIGSIALIAPSAADVRDVMIEGDSGLLRIAPPWFKPQYHPSKRQVEWPNGAVAITYSAEDPDQLRGPNIDGAWCDELAAWKYAQEAYDMLMMTLRRGAHPRAVITTTPRPTKIIRELVSSPLVHLTKRPTTDNAVNLAPAFMQQIMAKYAGTRLGRQELEAEILDDNPGALWKREPMLDALRVTRTPDLTRVVVAIDPAVTSGEGSDETGIIVAGLGADGHGYVLDDKSLRASPDTWAREAIAAYHTRGADRVIAETNNGGELVATVLRTIDGSVAYRAVHASRGKVARAEPVAALYEQGRVHHVGVFPDLEDQLTTWTQGDASPDRLDALVWALTELMLSTEPTPNIRFIDWE